MKQLLLPLFIVGIFALSCQGSDNQITNIEVPAYYNASHAKTLTAIDDYLSLIVDGYRFPISQLRELCYPTFLIGSDKVWSYDEHKKLIENFNMVGGVDFLGRITAGKLRLLTDFPFYPEGNRYMTYIVNSEKIPVGDVQVYVLTESVVTDQKKRNDVVDLMKKEFKDIKPRYTQVVAKTILSEDLQFIFAIVDTKTHKIIGLLEDWRMSTADLDSQGELVNLEEVRQQYSTSPKTASATPFFVYVRLVVQGHDKRNKRAIHSGIVEMQSISEDEKYRLIDKFEASYLESIEAKMYNHYVLDRDCLIFSSYAEASKDRGSRDR